MIDMPRKSKKKSRRKCTRAAKRAPRFPAGLVDRLVLLLVSNVQPDAIRQAGEKLDVTDRTLDAALLEARRRITLAADYNRVDEIGTAYVRLNEVFRRALAIQDNKTALAAQRELCKLLRLYDAVSPAAGGAGGAADDRTAATEDAARARAHLVTLGLGEADESLTELARLAVLRIVELTPERTDDA